MSLRLKHAHAMLVFGIILICIAPPFYTASFLTKSVLYDQISLITITSGVILLMAFFVYYPRLRRLPSREDSSCWTK